MIHEADEAVEAACVSGGQMRAVNMLRHNQRVSRCQVSTKKQCDPSVDLPLLAQQHKLALGSKIVILCIYYGYASLRACQLTARLHTVIFCVVSVFCMNIVCVCVHHFLAEAEERAEERLGVRTSQT